MFPCIGNCELVNDVCIKCYRTLNELVRWQTVSNETKRRIMQLTREREQLVNISPE
jgi:predicted Fe-S protein YdhL (DUF1289 family)